MKTIHAPANAGHSGSAAGWKNPVQLIFACRNVARRGNGVPSYGEARTFGVARARVPFLHGKTAPMNGRSLWLHGLDRHMFCKCDTTHHSQRSTLNHQHASSYAQH